LFVWTLVYYKRWYTVSYKGSADPNMEKNPDLACMWFAQACSQHRASLASPPPSLFQDQLLGAAHVTYYVAVIPIVAVQYTRLYYEGVPCIVVLVSVLVSILVVLFLYIYTGAVYEIETAIKAWGRWAPCEPPKDKAGAAGDGSGDGVAWIKGVRYTKGAVVLHDAGWYRCEDNQSLAEPGSWLPLAIHVIFGDAVFTLRCLLAAQSLLLCVQFTMMVVARRWLPMFWALFCNCVVLYQTIAITRAAAARVKERVRRKEKGAQGSKR